MLITEQYDFTLTTHEGIEVGVITDQSLRVSVFHVEHRETIETDANELFDDRDWDEYDELYTELERTNRI